jgi:hypothetical protein
MTKSESRTLLLISVEACVLCIQPCTTIVWGCVVEIRTWVMECTFFPTSGNGFFVGVEAAVAVYKNSKFNLLVSTKGHSVQSVVIRI